jgi:hypothetical protein
LACASRNRDWESEIFDDFKGHHQLTGVVLGPPAH